MAIPCPPNAYHGLQYQDMTSGTSRGARREKEPSSSIKVTHSALTLERCEQTPRLSRQALFKEGLQVHR